MHIKYIGNKLKGDSCIKEHYSPVCRPWFISATQKSKGEEYIDISGHRGAFPRSI